MPWFYYVLSTSITSQELIVMVSGALVYLPACLTFVILAYVNMEYSKSPTSLILNNIIIPHDCDDHREQLYRISFSLIVTQLTCLILGMILSSKHTARFDSLVPLMFSKVI